MVFQEFGRQPEACLAYSIGFLLNRIIIVLAVVFEAVAVFIKFCVMQLDDVRGPLAQRPTCEFPARDIKFLSVALIVEVPAKRLRTYCS